jgi:hypothetical protein
MNKIFTLLLVSALYIQNINAQANAGPDQTICSNSTFMQAGNPFPNTGIWTVVSGTGSFVNPTLYNTQLTDIGQGTNEYQWLVTIGSDVFQDNVTITNNQVFAHAGSDGFVCGVQGPGATYTLNATQASPPMTGFWSGAPAPGATIVNPTLYNTKVTGMQNGDHVYHWTVFLTYNGTTCSNTDDVTIHVRIPTESVVALPDDYEICEDFTNLQANVPVWGNGTWSEIPFLNPGTVIMDNTANVTTVTGVGLDTRRFVWTINYDGCISIDTITVHNNMILADADDRIDQNASLNIIAMNDTAICQDWIFLSANDPNAWNSGSAPFPIGLWTAFPGTVTFDNNTFYNTTARNLNHVGANLSQLTWTVTRGGCTEVSILDVLSNVFDVDASTSTLNDSLETCNGSIILDGEQPGVGTGVWTINNGWGTIINPTLYNTLVSNINPGSNNIFRWNVTRSNCTFYGEVVVANNAVSSNAGVDQTTCDDSFTLSGGVPQPGQTGLWQSVIPGIAVVTSPKLFNSGVTGLVQGTNTFRWVITKGNCSAFDEVVITNNSPDDFTVEADKEVCTNNSTLSVTPAPVIGTGIWTKSAAGIFTTIIDPTNINTAVTDLQPGINEFLWTVSNGVCSNQDNLIITNNTVVAEAGPDQIICSNFTQLEAIDPQWYEPGLGTGIWTNISNNGAVISDPSTINSVVSNLPLGISTFRWTLTEGNCTDFDDVLIQNGSVDVSDAGSDQYNCTDSAQLNAEIPSFGIGEWDLVQGTGTIADPTLFNTWVYGLGAGQNVFRWTITGGASACTSEDYVNVFNMEIDAYAGLDDVTCDGDYVLQGNNPNGQFILPAYNAWGWWQQIPPAAPGEIVNPTLFNTQITNLDYDVNMFRWTLSNGFCNDFDEVIITNNMPTVAYAGPDTIVCHDYLVNLNANNPIRGNGHWRVIAGSATVTDPSLFNSGVTDLDYYCTPWTPDWYNNVNTINVFEWVISYNGCESTDQVSVLNGLPQNIDAGDDQTVCANKVNLDAFDEGSCSQWQWWEQLPDVGDFYNPETGVFIPDYPATENMPFNVHVEPIQDGVSRFVWHLRNNFMDSGGNPITCELTDTVSVNKIGDFEDIQAGTNDALCENYYSLDATDPNSIFTPPPFYVTDGRWETIFGLGTFDDITNHNTTVRNMGAQTNIYRWTVTNHTLGCTMTDDVYIHSARPSAAVAGPDNEICTDYSVLSANVPARYTQAYWDVAIGSATIINNSCTGFVCDALATNIGPGTNVFVWHVNNQYFGPYAGYSVVNPLVCELTDTLVITNRSIVADAGNTIYICADTVQLYANVPSGGSGLWLAAGTTTFASTGKNTSSLYNDVAVNLTRGKNTFLWSANVGICTNSDQLVVWNNLPAPNPNAGADQIICSDETVLAANSITRNDTWYDITGTTITQEGYSSPEWSVGLGTGTFDNPSYTNTWVRNVSPAYNEYIWNAYYHFTDYKYETGIPGVYGTFHQTCRLTDTVHIYYNSVLADAGPDATVCGLEGIGAEYTLNASQVFPPMTGFWSGAPAPGATITNPTLYNTTVTGMQNGDHVYHWTVFLPYNGTTCSNTDDVTIHVRIPTESVVALPDEYDICEDYTTLRANIPMWGSGSWSEVPFQTPGTVIVNPTNYITDVTGIGQDTRRFVWTINFDGCMSSDTITLHNNMAIAYAGEDQTLPPMTDETYFEADLEADQTGYWSIVSGGAHITDINDPVSFVYDLQNGVNTFRWNVSNSLGCEGSDEMNILVANFIPNAGPDQIVCTDTAKLNATFVPNADDQRWSIVSGTGQFDDIYDPKTVVRNILWGANIYRWTVYFPGYSDYDDVVITYDYIFVSAGEDVSVCGDSYQMDAQFIEGADHLWTPIGLGGGTIVDNSAWNTLITDLPIGTNVFNWHVENGNCSSDDIVVISRNAKPIADFTVSPAESCPPANVLMENISNFIPGFTPPDEFRWFVNGAFLGTTYSIDNNINHLFTNTAQTDSTYTVNMIAYDNETGCNDTATQIVLVYAMPLVDFDLDPHVTEFPNATIEIENLSDLDLELYYWEFGDGNYISQTEWVNAIAHTYATWGTFYVTLTGTSDLSCEAQFTDSVIILEANSVSDISNDYKLYPNPADNRITLSSSANLNDAVIEIENASGQSVYYSLLNQNKKEYVLDISALANGFYILKISLDNQTKLMKFVKK